MTLVSLSPITLNESLPLDAQPLQDELLLITHSLEDPPQGGRAMLSRVNADALREIYGEQLQVFELQKVVVKGFGGIVKALNGEIDGVSGDTIKQALAYIQHSEVNTVFVDGSNLGELVRCIRKAFPAIRLFTFFHNVESRFFLGALRQSKTLHALGVWLANFLAERKAVKYSDHLLCLNERDCQLLKATYGRAGTDICPMALQDQVTELDQSSAPPLAGPYALFVGGTFYANLAGIRWYAAQVAPNIAIPTCVVGRGFDAYRDELESHGNIRVVGEVDSLRPWYHHARFVVAPIFDGSGMKTKVAEALMYGKRVVGTPEAFVGYEAVMRQAGTVCRTADDFICAIARVIDSPVDGFQQELRTLYLEHFSQAGAVRRLERILVDSLVVPQS